MSNNASAAAAITAALLKNDEGIEVTTSTSEDGSSVRRYHCNRRIHVVDRRQGSRTTRLLPCSPEHQSCFSWQCPSCARLEATITRVHVLQERFPALKKEDFVLALRQARGSVKGATHVLQKFVAPVPDPQLIHEVSSRYYGTAPLPKLLIIQALQLNSLNSEQTREWLLEESPVIIEKCFDMAAAAKEWQSGAETKKAAAVPTDALEKWKSESACKPNTEARNRHCLVPVLLQDVDNSSSSSKSCILCTARGDSGMQCCRFCFLCVECIDAGVVNTCPSLANGSALHAHPLQLQFDRVDCACDVHSSTACTNKIDDEEEEASIFWTCRECDYDVCTYCISSSPEDNINNMLLRVERAATTTDQRENPCRVLETLSEDTCAKRLLEKLEEFGSTNDAAAPSCEGRASEHSEDVSVMEDDDDMTASNAVLLQKCDEESKSWGSLADRAVAISSEAKPKSPSLRNDDGAEVSTAMVDGIETYYCGRHVVPRATRHADAAFCSAEREEEQCPSCARLQASFRLDTLREQFAGLTDIVLVAALRANGGDADRAVVWLVDRGAVLNHESPHLIQQVANAFRIPRAMAKAAIQQHNTISHSWLGVWLSEPANMQACFERAVRDKYDKEQKPQASLQKVPDALVALGRAEPTFSGKDDSKDEKVVVRNGHCLVVADKDRQSCVLCACSLPSTLGGARQCRACCLCEGCISLVRTCPGLANGGELHLHPLSYCLDRSWCVCDIEGDGCVQKENEETNENAKAFWSCRECDFDVCMACIRSPVPDNYNRALRRRVSDEDDVSIIDSSEEDDGLEEEEEDCSSDDDDEEESDVDSDDNESFSYDSDGLFASFDAASAERQAAFQWENALQQSTRVDVLVGTGRVGTTAPAGTNPRDHQDDDEFSQTELDRDLVPLAGRKLSSQATTALDLFRRPKHGQNDDDSQANQIESHGASAVDVTLVEDILQQAETIRDKKLRRQLYQAVAAGRIDLAGTLLLANLYASSMKGNSVAENGVTKCWCGEALHAADERVGCLRGHFMHGHCAADLLLGGDVCPTCRVPIFYPRITAAETREAADFVKEQALLSQKEEEEKAQRELDELVGSQELLSLNVGDVVHITSDTDVCAQVQGGDPIAGGLNDDMLELCGSKGSITEVVHDDGKTIGVRVRPIGANRQTHALIENDGFDCEACDMFGPSPETGDRVCVNCRICETCCQRGPRHRCRSSRTTRDWLWNPTLVSLVRRAGNTTLEGGDIEDPEGTVAAMKSVNQHMHQLRAELVAVKAAREVVKAETDNVFSGTRSPKIIDQGPVDLKRALECCGEASKLSLADLLRAGHLLALCMEWGDDEHAKAKRALLYHDVEAGDLDTVARKIRSENTARTVENLLWSDAAQETGQYNVKSFAKVDLVAFPRPSAPKTGYSLDPGSRFWSKREWMDSAGVTWLQVAEGPKRCGEKVVAEPGDYTELVGARVSRGKDWGRRNCDEDGGEGTEGTIIKAHADNRVTVRWDGVGGLVRTYRAAADDYHYLSFSSTPPAQGWLCVHPAGVGAPSVVVRTSNALRCSGCGDGLRPFDTISDKVVSTRESELSRGDRVFVAATLEPVVITSIVEGRIYCSFADDIGKEQDALDNSFVARGTVGGKKNETGFDVPSDDGSVWYRHEDLIRFSSGDREEKRNIGGRARTRHEFVAFFDRDAIAARKAWEDAKPRNELSPQCTVSSCVRGHLLHARCLQGALFAGRCCPESGCSEPLWVPKVRRVQDSESDGDGCEANRGAVAEEEILKAASDLTEQSATVAARAVEAERSAADEMNLAGWDELKMCPACCAGPLYNENCSDMKRHHGECATLLLQRDAGADPEPCTPCGIFRAKPSDIARLMAQTSGTKSVPDILPRCPKHDSLVMFNGCLACGYLFTDIDWHDMPHWDPFAKDLLELDRRKMNAARLLAEQVRQEAALLQVEHNALLSLK